MMLSCSSSDELIVAPSADAFLLQAYEAPTEDPTGEPSGLDAEGLDDDPSEDTGLLGQSKDSDSLLGPLQQNIAMKQLQQKLGF